MPAKKKKTGAKSAAKNAEIAQKVAELQFEQERERLRNEEFMLRQRLEEEENKVLENHRIREAEVRNAVSERERKAYYEAREKELVEQADLREREVQELRATVAGLQQAHQFLESERESATRRTAMLTNELELAQMRHLEAEAQTEATERTYQEATRSFEEKREEDQHTIAELRGECQMRDSQLSELQQLHTELQRRTRALRPAIAKKPSASAEGEDGAGAAAAEGDEEEKAITDMDPQSVDVETTVLLKVLNGEVAKYKALAMELQGTLDHKDRDEEKSSLLVGILNTQLDSVREENKRLYATAQTRLREVQATQTVLDEERARNKQLYEQFDRATSEAAVQQRQLQLEVGVHRAQVDELTSKLDALTKEHKELQATHKVHVDRSLNREQEDFQTNVSMKGELEKQKLDMAVLLKEKQQSEEEAFNYKILSRAEVDSLKTRLQKFQEAMEKADRTSYETITVLRADVDRLTLERSTVTDTHKEEKKRLVSDLERTTEHRDSLQAQLDALAARATATEKDLYEKLVHMTACHDARGEEVDRLRERLQEKEEEYTNNAIYLNAEKENLHAKLEELQQDAQKRRREHIQHIEKITSEVTDLQARLAREVGDLSGARKLETDRADLAERNVKRMQEQLREAQEQARTTQLGNEQVVKSLKAECRDARSELGIAKRTIERLEVAIGDQAGYVQLTELNEKLMREVDGYRNQVAGLNSTVASMKMEQDIMGGYKVQKLGEENEQLSRRISQLERYQRLTVPLFAELRSIAERGSLPTTLRDSLAKYDVQVSRMSRKEITVVGTSAAADGDAAAMEAAPAAGLMSTLPAMLRPAPPPQRRTVYASVDKLPGNSNCAAVATNHLPYIDV